jgi:hypothetical protein
MSAVMSVSTRINEVGRFAVKTPYNREWVAEAKLWGGRWNPETKEWHFDTAAEDNVRRLLVDIYGTDGSDAGHVDELTLAVEAGLAKVNGEGSVTPPPAGAGTRPEALLRIKELIRTWKVTKAEVRTLFEDN